MPPLGMSRQASRDFDNVRLQVEALVSNFSTSVMDVLGKYHQCTLEHCTAELGAVKTQLAQQQKEFQKELDYRNGVILRLEKERNDVVMRLEKEKNDIKMEMEHRIQEARKIANFERLDLRPSPTYHLHNMVQQVESEPEAPATQSRALESVISRLKNKQKRQAPRRRHTHDVSRDVTREVPKTATASPPSVLNHPEPVPDLIPVVNTVQITERVVEVKQEYDVDDNDVDVLQEQEVEKPATPDYTGEGFDIVDKAAQKEKSMPQENGKSKNDRPTEKKTALPNGIPDSPPPSNHHHGKKHHGSSKNDDHKPMDTNQSSKPAERPSTSRKPSTSSEGRSCSQPAPVPSTSQTPDNDRTSETSQEPASHSDTSSDGERPTNNNDLTFVNRQQSDDQLSLPLKKRSARRRGGSSGQQAKPKTPEPNEKPKPRRVKALSTESRGSAEPRSAESRSVSVDARLEDSRLSVESRVEVSPESREVRVSSASVAISGDEITALPSESAKSKALKRKRAASLDMERLLTPAPRRSTKTSRAARGDQSDSDIEDPEIQFNIKPIPEPEADPTQEILEIGVVHASNTPILSQPKPSPIKVKVKVKTAKVKVKPAKVKRSKSATVGRPRKKKAVADGVIYDCTQPRCTESFSSREEFHEHVLSHGSKKRKISTPSVDESESKIESEAGMSEVVDENEITESMTTEEVVTTEDEIMESETIADLDDTETEIVLEGVDTETEFFAYDPEELADPEPAPEPEPEQKPEVSSKTAKRGRPAGRPAKKTKKEKKEKRKVSKSRSKSKSKTPKENIAVTQPELSQEMSTPVAPESLVPEIVPKQEYHELKPVEVKTEPVSDMPNGGRNTPNSFGRNTPNSFGRNTPSSQRSQTPSSQGRNTPNSLGRSTPTNRGVRRSVYHGPIHRCNECPATFKYKYCLDNHRGVHTNEHEHKCPGCSASFRTQKGLNDHMAVHNTSLLKCLICSSEFKKQDQLTAHIITEHTDNPDPPMNKDLPHNTVLTTPKAPSTNEKKSPLKTLYPCTYCTHIADSTESLAEHVSQHKNDRGWKCTYCPSTFRWKGSLDVHMARHQDEAVPCKQCGMVLQSQALLKAHENAEHKLKFEVLSEAEAIAQAMGDMSH